MPAFYITGIDNVTVEIDSEEVPIMDGSSKDFINAIEKIDLKDQLKKRKFLKICKNIEFTDGKKEISIRPNLSSLEVSFKLNYDNKIVGKQENTINFQKDELEDVTSSRTFVYLRI